MEWTRLTTMPVPCRPASLPLLLVGAAGPASAYVAPIGVAYLLALEEANRLSLGADDNILCFHGVRSLESQVTLLRFLQQPCQKSLADHSLPALIIVT